MDERNQTATDNYRLLFAAVRHLCRTEPQVAMAVKLCGSVHELACELHVEYLRTITTWLELSEPRLKLSTYVYNMVKWASHRVIGYSRLLRLPGNGSGVTEETLRRYALADRDHLNFNGKEGECEDEALLVRDDKDRFFDIEDAKSMIGPHLQKLSKRHQLALKLSYFDGLNLEQCGKGLGVTRERARQIIVRAISKLEDRLKETKSMPVPEVPVPEVPRSLTLIVPPKPELSPVLDDQSPVLDDQRHVERNLKIRVEAEGKQDRLDGLPVTANPYTKGSPEWRYWNSGWLPRW